MANVTSSRLFLERAGIYGTYRATTPAVAPDQSGIHNPAGFPWNDMPLPIESLIPDNEVSPAGGVTNEPWPRGE